MALLRSRYVSVAAVALLALATPLFLVTTNLRVVIFSGWLYTYGFERHHVTERSGIEPRDLTRISREIKAYFRASGDEPLHVRATVYGEERDLFNQRETDHMADVKGLVRGLQLWQRATFLYIAAFALAGATLWGLRSAARRLATGLLWGSVLAVALLAIAGIGSLAAFDPLFTLFHNLGFAAGTWDFDPNTEWLVRIFPEGFFLTATLIVAGLTVGQAVLVGAAIAAYRWRRRAPRAVDQSAGRDQPSHTVSKGL